MSGVTLDFVQIDEPLNPDIDHIGRTNVVTVESASGATAVEADDTGPLGTAAIGPNPKRFEVNPATDDVLPGRAHYELVRATEPTPRYPKVEPNLNGHPGIVPAVAALDVGDRLSLTSIPPELGRPEADTLVMGYTEVIGDHSRSIVFNTDRGGILSHVGVLDGGATACLQTRGAQLGAAITDAQTSFLVATTSGSLFTTSPPAGARIIVRDREVMPVVSVASSIRSTFNGTAVNGWDTLDTGQAWVVGSGTAANFSESSGTGRIAISATNVEHHIAVNLAYAPYQRVRVFHTLGVTPTGAGVNWGLMLRRADASNLYWIDAQVGTDGAITLRVISKISGANTQLATVVSRTAHSATVPRIMMADIDDDDVIRVKLWSSDVAEPRGWELEHQGSHTDLQSGPSVGCIARLMTGNTNATPVTFTFDNFAVLNPQAITVTRDPDKRMAHPAGGDVRVHQALRVTL